MAFDILESLNSALGGPITRQLSSSLGETEDSTRAAVRSVGPTMLAGLMHQASTPSGAADVFRAVNDERIDTGIVGKLGNMFGNRGSMDSMRGLGESLAGTVFGNRSGAVTNAISQVSGIRPSSALSMLSMGLPVIFGMLRKQASSNGLDAGGLSSLLFSQRASLERAGLDSRITSALGFSSLSNLLSAVPGGSASRQQRATDRDRAPAYEPARPKRSGWLPWVIAAGIAVLAILLILNRPSQRDMVPTAQTTGERAAGPSTATTQVYFDTGATTLNGEGRQKIASVAESAKGQDRAIAVIGYANNSGDREQGVEVAKNRAVAVKDALVAEGVAESRIVMDPPATMSGAGTEAEARRVDIELR
jgi:OmpA-OmpF porin, OOP family